MVETGIAIEGDKSCWRYKMQSKRKRSATN